MPAIRPPWSRRRFLAGTASAGAAMLVRGVGAAAPAAATRKAAPNIVFIITDQQHIESIQATGCPSIRTPGMDHLVKHGTSFCESHSTNPLCSPARSSIFTGRPTSETGVYQNNLAIREDAPNLGQWLRQEAGYDCVYAGKWHLPRGFTHDIPGFRVLTTGIGGQGNLGDTTTATICAGFLRSRGTSGRPFFLVASFLQPHDICEWLRLHQDPLEELPYPELAAQLPPLPANFGFDPREPEVVSSRRKGNEGVRHNWSEQQWRYYIWSYYRHVEMVDAEILRIVDALEESGLARDTVVIFTSDHGEGTAHHQMTRKNSLYEEALKVPLVISWPGHVPTDRNDRTTLVSGYDIAPTICDFAGASPPPYVRGRTLRPVFEEQPVERRDACFSEVLNNAGRMVRTEHWKYITYRDDPVEQLFDMQTDRGELCNLAGQAAQADVLRAHRNLLAQWERHLDVAPQVPEPAAFRRT